LERHTLSYETAQVISIIVLLRYRLTYSRRTILVYDPLRGRVLRGSFKDLIERTHGGYNELVVSQMRRKSVAQEVRAMAREWTYGGAMLELKVSQVSSLVGITRVEPH
jgi:hypothetical protein